MRTLLYASATMAMYSCPPCTNNQTPSGTGDPSAPSGQADNLASRAGDYAYAYLRSDDYTSLLVEVDYVQGRRPSAAALDALQEALETYLDKPDGVGIVLDNEIPAQGAPVWSYTAAQDLEIAYRNHYRDPAAKEAVLYYLYLDGNSDSDDSNGRVLGYAYHGSSLVMFKDTIDSVNSTPLLTAEVEPTVIVHELGHVLGLVNNGIPMQTNHQDTGHGAHDNNRDCLMYWAVETDNIVDLLLDGPPVFDAACEADMAAVRGN